MIRVAIGTPAIALVLAAVANAQTETRIVGNLQVTVSARLSPKRLPRDSRAPVAVNLDWKIATTDGTEPATLKKLQIEINRNGILDPTGLPVCPYDRIQPASTERALKNCRSSLVGKGGFAALVGLEGQESYVANGRMVVFNSERGRPAGSLWSDLFGSAVCQLLVIIFKVDKLKKGPYGTALTATLPKSLRAWGNLTEIQNATLSHLLRGGQAQELPQRDVSDPQGSWNRQLQPGPHELRLRGGIEGVIDPRRRLQGQALAGPVHIDYRPSPWRPSS